MHTQGTSHKSLYRLLAGVLLVIFYAAGASAAQCTAGLSASEIDGGRTVAFTATGTASGTLPGGSQNWVVEIKVYIDDLYVGKGLSCETPSSCTYSGTIATHCYASGPHTVRADVSCQAGSDTASDDVTLPKDGSLEITNHGSTAAGVFTGQILYNLGRHGGGRLDYYVEQPDGSEQWYNGSWLGPDPVGHLDWTVFTDCWPERAYRIRAEMTTCDDEYTDEDALEVPSHKPTISLTAMDDSPSTKFLVKWKFPQTGARYVRVEWEPDGATIWETGLNTPLEGQEIITLSSCVVGERDQIKAWARACNDMESGYTETEVPVTLPKCEVKCCCDEGPQPPECAGDPVRVTSGNMRMSDRDPLPGAMLAPLQRTYDSKRTTGLFGRGWMSVFDAWLKGTGVKSEFDRVLIESESGDRSVFVLANGAYRQVWPVVQSTPGALVQDGSGDFLYRESGSNVIRLFRGGRLVALRTAGSDHEVTITYDANGRPTAVADSRGTWAWTVNTTNGRITAISVNGLPNLQWTYTRDANGNLTTVSTTAGVWRTYTYSNDRMEEARDGVGHRIESHLYDASGQALTSSGDQGEITAIEYDQPGRTAGEWRSRVTYANGRTTDYYSRYLAGKMRTVEIDGACDCGTEDAVYVHDDNGRVIRAQDALGYIREVHYADDRLASETTSLGPGGCDPASDPQRCRLTPEGLAGAILSPTTESRTMSYEYSDANWPDRVTRTTTSSVFQSGGTKGQTFVYDAASGTLLAHSVTGWTGVPAHEETRTTTTTLYDGIEGAAFDPGGSFDSAWLTLPQPQRERKWVDGPRTDVSDLTTFVYYPIDASVTATLRGRLAASRNAAGHITRFEAYDIFGNATRIVDPNGVAIEAAHDALGRVTTTTLRGVSGCDTTLDPLCATDITHSRVYDGAGPLESETRDGSVTAYTYDDRGRVQTISRGPSANDLRERIEYVYDPATGKKNEERVLAFENGSWAEKKRQSYAYNTAEQLETITHADGTSVEYTYGPGSQLLTVRDENHAEPNTAYKYDVGGRLEEALQTLATASGGSIKTRYAYDLDGNLTSVTDPNGNATTYRYDDFGQMLEQVSRVTGVTRYTYDAGGQLLSTTSADLATTTRTYDVLGRVVSATSVKAERSESVTWSYDAGAFGKGRLTTMTDPTGTTAYAWDRRGLLLSETRSIGVATYVSAFGYDAEGHRTHITYPSGRGVDYQFDHAGRPVSVVTDGTVLVSSASYLPFGPLHTMVLGNGTTRTMTFDARYRVKTNRLDGPGSGPQDEEPPGAIASYEYGYDAVGNMTAIDDRVVESPENRDYDRELGYDDLNRLIVANSGPGLWSSGAYTYDAMGTMRSRTIGANVQNFATIGTTPKLATVEQDGRLDPVTYDALGNEVVNGARTYDYSARNHLLAAGARTYVYDGRGIRTSTFFAVTLASLSLDTALASPNQIVTGTLSLTGLAPAGGASVRLGSSSSALVVPDKVLIEAGQASATFSLTIPSNAQPETITLTAIYATTLTAALEITGGSALSTFTVAPASLIGGNPITAEVSLNEVAPEGGAVVAITSESDAISGGTITIDAGTTTGSTVLATNPVASVIAVPLTASYAGSSLETSVELQPETPAVDRLVITPDGVIGGEITTGTITLVDPPPAEGRTFTLTSSNPSIAAVPTTIQLGGDCGDGDGENCTPSSSSSSSSFPITTFAVATGETVTITATGGTLTLEATLTVVCANGSTPTPTFPEGQTVFIDDALPGGAAMSGELHWELGHPASGDYALVAPYAGSGVYRTVITGLSESLTESEKLFAYARVADCAVPREIFFRAKIGGTSVTAYWGEPLYGVTSESMNMGAVPLGGTWERLELLLRNLEAGGDPSISELELAYVDGQVWFDRLGRMADCATPTASQPTVPSDEDVFLDEEIPTWVTLKNTSNGPLAWTSAQAASSALSLVNPYRGDGTYVTGIAGLSQPLPAGAKLSLYALVDSCSPPVRQIHLRITTTSGTGTVSWGESIWDVDEGTISMGAVPAAGMWTRLEVPLDQLGLDSGTLTRIDVAHVDGRVWFDRFATWPLLRAILTGFTSDHESTVPHGTTVTWTATATGTVQPLEYRFERRDPEGNWSIVQNYGGQNTYSWTPMGQELGTYAIRVSVRNGGSQAGFDDTETLMVRVVESGEGLLWSDPDVRLAWWKRWLHRPAPPVSLGIDYGEVATNTALPVRHSLYSAELQLLAETEVSEAATPAIAHEYVWFAGQPLAQIATATGAIDWYFNDHLGTPILQTDASAQVTWRVEYEPYGEVYAYRAGATKHQPLRFPGQENDGGEELSYNIFRWYRSGWGRYTSSDPIGLQGGMNVYGYVDGNPLRYADPLGLARNPREMNCCELLGEILRLTQELSRRTLDEQRIQRSLLTGGLVRMNITNIIQYWLHRREYEAKQRRVRKLVREYDRQNCPDPLQTSTRQWVDRAFPDDDYLWELWGDTIERQFYEGPPKPEGPVFLPPVAGAPIPVFP